MKTTAHKIINNNEVKFDTRFNLFEETAPRERFKSDNFRELELNYAIGMPTRKAAERLNRLRRETSGIIPTTLRNNVENEGISLQCQKEVLAEKVLLDNGFTVEAEYPQPEKFVRDEQKHVNLEIVQKAANALNIKHFEPCDYEAPEASVNISIDDVCVKRQSETRPKDETEEQPKRVNNTVIHVQYNDSKSLLNAKSIPAAIKLLIGLLLNSHLLSKQLVFFTDGARDIHSWITKLFPFANYKIILDWYHLSKKCREQLSMILYGSKARNAFLDKLLPCLWFGNVNGAIKLLNELAPKQVRNQDLLKKLIEYLQRVSDYIPNYALRKELKLRNSSNLGEKANDLLVAARQKHNGMSWSNSGSLALVAISSAYYNDEIADYIYDGKVSLQLPLVA
jgi:hypothetical protein